MAELVDALDSGSSRGNLVDVRVILAAILQHKTRVYNQREIHGLSQHNSTCSQWSY
jgi:hypothetical protein